MIVELKKPQFFIDYKRKLSDTILNKRKCMDGMDYSTFFSIFVLKVNISPVSYKVKS